MQEMENHKTAAQERGPGYAPWLVYLLYIGSLFIGLTALIGVIVAYMQRRDAPEWLYSHYQYQIYTFWIGLIVFIAAVLTMTLAGIGLLLGMLLTIWLLVRCIYGMRQLYVREPVPAPESLLFGWNRNG
ncbi:MAG: DUF4870 family protein [Halorhodospira sp.]